MATSYYNEQTKVLITQRTREMIDRETGEQVFVDNIGKSIYGAKNFWKCYLMDFLCILGIIDSKQVDVFVYICENTQQADNIFIGTYRKIADDTNVSVGTVHKIMIKLQQNNFVRKVQNGVWFVNPNVLMKGNDRKRQILLSYYQADEPINSITCERIKRDEIKAVPDKPVNEIQQNLNFDN